MLISPPSPPIRSPSTSRHPGAANMLTAYFAAPAARWSDGVKRTRLLKPAGGQCAMALAATFEGSVHEVRLTISSADACLGYARAVMAVSRWLDPWMRNRLFRKYVVPFVAVVSGALLTNGLVEIYFTYQESRAQLAQIQREKASAAALQIEQFVREIERQMGWTTQPQVVAVPGALEQRQIDYVRLLRQVPAITEVAFLDGRGREQLRVSRLAMDVVAGGADVSGEPRFRETRGGRVWYGPVYCRKESEPYLTPG